MLWNISFLQREKGSFLLIKNKLFPRGGPALALLLLNLSLAARMLDGSWNSGEILSGAEFSPLYCSSQLSTGKAWISLQRKLPNICFSLEGNINTNNHLACAPHFRLSLLSRNPFAENIRSPSKPPPWGSAVHPVLHKASRMSAL